MSLKAQHKDVTFSVGDSLKIVQKITEGEKKRLQAFEGLLLGIKGKNENTSITVRRIGAGQIGIERIFPLASPTIEKIEVTRKGGRGVRHAKIYYVRTKSKKEVEKIYSKASKKEITKAAKKSEKAKNTKRPSKPSPKSKKPYPSSKKTSIKTSKRTSKK